MSAPDGGSTPARSAAGPALKGLSLGRLAWLQASHRRPSAAGLGFCLLIALVLPALLSLADGVALQRALADTLARDGGFSVEQKVSDVDQFGALKRDVAATVARRLGGALVPVTAHVSTGPLHPTTVNTDPVPASVSARALRAEYLDGLANHVEMLAGQLPPDGLGGGDTAVTMPQSGADAAGFNLFDRVCVAFAGGGDRESRWCARIVGLWRPLDAHDPFWAGRVPGLELAMGRYDYFKLAQRQPPQGTLAGVGFRTDPAAVDSARAATFAESVRELAGELQTPGRRVVTALDSSLLRLAEQHRAIAASLHLFIALMALLGLVVVGVVGFRFLGEQARLLSVLRARGFPPARTWLLAFLGLVAPALYGLPLAVAACLLVVALVAPGGPGAGPSALGADQGRPALAVCGLMALLLTALLALVAASATWRELPPGQQSSFRLRGRERPRTLRAALAALLGLAMLLASRVVSLPGGSGGSGSMLQLGLEALAAVGILCLAFAAVALLPGWPLRLAARRSVARLLAGWQLERGHGQQAGVAVAVALAAAAGVFGALTAAWARTPQAALEPALRQGVEYGVALGCLGILALVLVGTAAHYGAATRRRLEEYSGLVAHGMTPRQLRTSLVAEQAATAAWSVVAGAILGIALALAGLGLTPAGSAPIGMELLGVAAVAGSLLAAILAAGALARRLPDRLDLVRGGMES